MDELYIPQGLKKKREYFEGYGWSEFRITILSVIITFAFCCFLYIVTKNLFLAVLLILIIPSTTVLLIVKNDSNISVIDQARFLISFAKDQKSYEYQYRDELAYEID